MKIVRLMIAIKVIKFIARNVEKCGGYLNLIEYERRFYVPNARESCNL